MHEQHKRIQLRVDMIKIPEREDFSKFLPFLLKYSRAGKNLTKSH